MTPVFLGTIGIVANMVGVLLLFAFGSPLRIPTGGVQVLSLNDPIPKEKRIDSLFAFLSWVGLICVLIGNALQVWALNIA